MEMTSRERMKRVFAHQEPDRIPVIDNPWKSTVERWRSEGLPEGMDFVDFFGLDSVAEISVDSSPRYETKVLEETQEYVICTTGWGATLKQWKHQDSTPEFLDFTTTNREKWAEAKARMVPSRDRIPWDDLARNYHEWRKKDAWIQGDFWFGFDVTHSWTVGTEVFLIAMMEEPEWCVDMFNHYLDMSMALFDTVWDAGYTFDSIFWPDDMGYKNNQFFSVKTYRELLKPVHQRAVEWAHQKGIKVHIHSCGDINPFVPELIEIGIDAINPLEVKAGMDPVELKRKYGKDVVLHGGVNAVLWNDMDALREEMKKVIAAMKESGGYIFSSDHSVPSTVSLKDFSGIVRLAKELGSY